MKILVSGSKGQLGRDCVQILRDGHEVVEADLPEWDVTDAFAVDRLVAGQRPNVLINCAAYTQVDRAEAEPEAAERVNALAPRLLADAARRFDARLIHISTDYVFDGAKPYPQAFTEADTPAPISCYGRTKRAGEEAVLESGSNFVILRTAWLYGIGGKNFLTTILRAALSRPAPPLRVVNDQYGCPTWSWRLARQIREMLDKGQGIYHAVGEGSCTWYELARYFLDALGVECAVQPCATADYPTAARRPANSFLRNKRLTEEGLNRMRPWKADVREFAAQLRLTNRGSGGYQANL